MPSHPVPSARPIDLARFKLARVEPAEGALRVGVVAARFNADIVDALLEGALRTLAEHDVRGDDVVLARVAGAWELPQVAQAMADSGEIDAIVALGCIIRGETSHYDVIVNESARALMNVSLKAGIAVANGVLAVENVAQAIARCGSLLEFQILRVLAAQHQLVRHHPIEDEAAHGCGVRVQQVAVCHQALGEQAARALLDQGAAAYLAA